MRFKKGQKVLLHTYSENIECVIVDVHPNDKFNPHYLIDINGRKMGWTPEYMMESMKLLKIEEILK